ncbi:unnamed protein product [Spirodela intermedia]|uniref:Uncharacterized protein n=1 Tax=Spirodela intermedia TaxID=51605 RepID=A0A7I8L1H8_SPIIN|nr:unnamed protein product [Spirodela intermedia]
MASGGGMKGFYRQKKKTTVGGGVAKPSAGAFKKKATGASLKGSSISPVEGDIAPPSALVSHDSFDLGEWLEHSAEEEALRQFDMDMRFGPCLGITRQERWERAARLGLNPPVELAGLLRGGASVKPDCLWEGRI